MLKLLFVVIVLGFLFKEFWFISDIDKQYNLTSSKVKIDTLPILQDSDNISNAFFNTKLWKLTPADQAREDDQYIQELDTNTTIAIISRKNSKQICKGSRCMTIKGFLSTTLILDDGNQTILLKPTQIIFDELKFIHYTDTKLYFENNKSKERYELEFFSYKLPLDTNETNTTETKKDTQ